MISATRPSVSRVLKALEAEGSIALAYGRVSVLDLPRLRALADGEDADSSV